MEAPPRPVSSDDVSFSDSDCEFDLDDDGLSGKSFQRGREAAARHEQSAWHAESSTPPTHPHTHQQAHHSLPPSPHRHQHVSTYTYMWSPTTSRRAGDLDFDLDHNDDGLSEAFFDHGRDGAARREQSA